MENENCDTIFFFENKKYAQIVHMYMYTKFEEPSLNSSYGQQPAGLTGRWRTTRHAGEMLDALL